MSEQGMFHLTGAVSAALFLLTFGGLWAQLQMVWRRRRRFVLNESTERPTAILSANQFVSSYLAFYSFFLYGLCLSPLNHYLIWPRLAASLMTLAVLWEMVRDRRDRWSWSAFLACGGLLVAGPATLLLLPTAAKWLATTSKGLIVIATIVLAQGYLHQVLVIRRTGQTGSVSARLHQFFFWKDVSTIAFGLTMTSGTGWPIILLSTVSGLTKLLTLWHFRWVRLSPVAEARRQPRRAES